MVEIRRVEPRELDALTRRFNERIHDRDSAEIRSWYDEHPELFLRAQMDDRRIGFAIGRARTETSVELVGISVADEYARRGIGSRLLARFERETNALGYGRVSLGSAGGYVDEFYLANGYRPESILVRTSRGKLPAGYRERFDVLRERAEGDTWRIYVEPDGYDPGQVAEVREYFDDPEAIYIMEKPL